MLESEKPDAEKCITTPATHGVFEVKLSENSYNVNTTRMTCTCGKWQITGIPCEHAYGAMIDAGLDVENYVSEFFSTSIWQIYSESLNPVRGPRFWMTRGYRLIVKPPESTLPGRKKKTKKKFPRFKGKNESPKKKKEKETLGRKGRIIHCSKCGEAGHNAAGCKVHPKKKMKTETMEEATGSTNGPDVIGLTQPTQTSKV